MLNERLILKMAEFNSGDPKRIQHFTKVYEYAHLIGTLERIDDETQKILEIAAIMHDIGIRPSEEKYGRCDGKLQEQEGPKYARKMLKDFPEVTDEAADRICWLIGHHHTYTGVEGIDHRILLEADFLVNAYEDELSVESICTFKEKVFRTKTGTELLGIMYGLKRS
ncbi:MAG: HD domain-containing protein [Oscillospiraceae bacterium]